ncbi:IclR family transcriptional regulator domain-containing protein [Chelatococcus reniformis]|uniref:Transcriptional regulator n=1 Tax=Chelatococcus reniformis TaxID=1494448 RepID=A0A916UD86_9HYPH|nr:IclR family transcriptional regulator C-terminal domain-containing protein [Chelatococcus reniformis]GGC67576.1 transcriptional regulator [Chelatococcus reniformis]
MPRLNRTAEEEEARREDPNFIESLDRGLRVLQVFGAEHRQMTLSDVAKAANLPRATARRILFTLERAGFVSGDGKLFQLLPRVLTLASAYLSSNQIVAVMQPAMDRLASQAREVCSLAILDGGEAVFVARASPARVFSSGLEIGYRLPAYCTSVGRVLLGGLSNEELARTIDALEPVKATPLTIVDKQLLLATVITDRSKGYSLVDQEAEDGFRSIAVPVRRYDDVIVAAINIGAHVDRISTGDMIDRYLPMLQSASASIGPLLL